MKMAQSVMLAALVGVLVSFSGYAAKPAVLYSAVSPDYVDGLHARYLQFIAKKLNRPIKIHAQPFARRLANLKSGQLDFLIGFSRKNNVQDDVIYIKPSYETQQRYLYVRGADAELAANQWRGRALGVSSHGRYKGFEEVFEQADLIEVSNLERKISMLQAGRIDGFVHYKQVSDWHIAAQGIAADIVPAHYQPGEEVPLYLVVSDKSRLKSSVKQLAQIIKQAKKDGEFAEIRRQYYSQQ